MAQSKEEVAQKSRENARRWRANNLERARAKSKAWYAANKERAHAYALEWAKKNPEKVAANAKATYERHRESRIERYKKYLKSEKGLATYDRAHARNTVVRTTGLALADIPEELVEAIIVVRKVKRAIRSA